MKKLVAFILVPLIILTFLCACSEKTDSAAADIYLSMAQEFLDNDNIDAAIDILNKGFSETKDPRLSEKLVMIYTQRDNERTTEHSAIVHTDATRPIMGVPTTAKPTMAKPTMVQPTTAKPTTAKPTTAQPTAAQPTTVQPAASQPAASQPTATQPTAAQPTVAQPTAAQPTAVQPTAAQLTTAMPTVGGPAVARPTAGKKPIVTTAMPVERATFAAGATATAVISGNGSKIQLTLGEILEVPQTLIDVGFDTAVKIENCMINSIKVIDEQIDRVAIIDAPPIHSLSGNMKVVIPYPDGTDIGTEFSAICMHATDTLSRSPGEMEFLFPVNTEDGIVVYVTGLSFVTLGWQS